METHPIAAEMDATYGTTKVERWASEQHFESARSQGVFGMAIDESNPKAARWPKA